MLIHAKSCTLVSRREGYVGFFKSGLQVVEVVDLVVHVIGMRFHELLNAFVPVTHRHYLPANCRSDAINYLLIWCFD